MATENLTVTAQEQAPQIGRVHKGEDIPRMLAAIVDLAYAINEQANVALNGNTLDQDGLLRGVQQLARQVGFLASLGQRDLGDSGAETNPIAWLCRGA